MHGRSIYLLVSLLALVAIGPWLTENIVGRGLWELLFTLVTLSSIHLLRVKRGEALISGLLAPPTLATVWLRQAVPDGHARGKVIGRLLLRADPSRSRRSGVPPASRRP